MRVQFTSTIHVPSPQNRSFQAGSNFQTAALPKFSGRTTTESMVFEAIRHGDSEKAKLLISDSILTSPAKLFLGNFRENCLNSLGQTPLMLACLHRDRDVFDTLMDRPQVDINLQDKQGYTALMYAIKGGGYALISLLINRPDVDVNLVSNKGVSALSLALRSDNPKVLETLARHPGLKIRPVERALAQKLGKLQTLEAIYQENLFQRQIYEINRQPHQIVDFLPHLFSYSPQVLSTYLSRVENSNDKHAQAPNLHGGEAEMMLMIRHPEATESFLGKISTALTSVTRFIHKQIWNVSPQTLSTWGDVGLLTHNFRAWRFDTQFGEDSLFAQYGFQPIPARETDGIFGKGYRLTGADAAPDTIAPETLVEFRRGYLLVSHPQQGTLVIRNSSKKFGRNLLPHPAYYSKASLSAEDLKTFNPKTDTRFWHILTPGLYKTPRIPDKLAFLTKELLLLKEDYASWKFDPRLFRAERFIGHESPGFKVMVNFLKELDFKQSMGEYNAPLPDLAFIHPDYPPFEPYARLSITPQMLDGELTDLVNNTWTQEKYPASQLMPFIQAGVDNQAELVLLGTEAAPK